MEYVDAPTLKQFCSGSQYELEERFPNLLDKIYNALYKAPKSVSLKYDSIFVKVHPRTGKFIIIATDL